MQEYSCEYICYFLFFSCNSECFIISKLIMIAKNDSKKNRDKKNVPTFGKHMWSSVKDHSHVTSAYFFDLFHQGLENANVKYGHHHL